MDSKGAGNIFSTWEKVAKQFSETSQDVSKAKNNNENLGQLKKSATKLQQVVNGFNDGLNNIPSTSSAKRPTSSALENKSKRKRKLSGQISLEELSQSIEKNPSPTTSVNLLRSCKSSEDKINLLYSWELSANRLQIRSAFHQGFYLQQLIKLKNYTVKQLFELFPQIPQPNIRRNLQLYNTLGDFRKILFSTLPVHRLWRSITSLKKELDVISSQEQLSWKEGNSDPSCFIKCYTQWFDEDPKQNIYYLLDIYDNDLGTFTEKSVIDQLCTTIAILKPEELKYPYTLLRDPVPELHHKRYMIYYHTFDTELGHCAIITKQDDGTWNCNDELLFKDQNKKWKDAGICIIKE